MKKFPIVLTALLLTTAGGPVWAKKSTPRKTSRKEWQQRKEDMRPLQLKNLIEENHRLKFGNQKLTEEVTTTQQELEKLLVLKAKIDALRKKKGQTTSEGDDNYAYLDALFTSKQQPQKIVSIDGLTQQEIERLLILKAKINALRKKKGQTTSEGDDNYTDLEALFASNQQPQKVVSIGGLTQEDWAVDENGRPYIKGVVFKVQIGAYRKRDLSKVLEKNRSQEVFEQEQEDDVNKYTLRHFRNYQKADRFKKELRVMGLKDAWIVPFKDGKRVPLKTILRQIRKK